MYGSEYKKRRPRFSNSELAALVNEVYRNKEILFSKKCSAYSNEQKSRAWQAVTDSINTVCLVEPRTPDEVRRKWYYYLSDKKKEIARHKLQKKKSSSTTRDILYSSSDLKILEILGEIDAGEAEDQDDENDNAIEGLVCEVDADALPLKSPSVSSANGDTVTAAYHEQKYDTATVTYEELQQSAYADGVNGYCESINGEDGAIGEAVGYDYDQQCQQSRLSRRRQKNEEEEDEAVDGEFLQMEKRRLVLQECQLQVLKDIQKQMQEDAERNRTFQEAFLDIQRKRLELKIAAQNAKK